MRRFERDLDVKMVSLESEWRQAYEASIGARAEFQRLSSSKQSSMDALDASKERLDRAEALTARVMTKIDRLEESVLGRS